MVGHCSSSSYRLQCFLPIRINGFFFCGTGNATLCIGCWALRYSVWFQAGVQEVKTIVKNNILLLVFLLTTLLACGFRGSGSKAPAAPTTVYTPSGKVGVVVSCKQTLTDCYKYASKQCGHYGYELHDAGSETSTETRGSAGVFNNFAITKSNSKSKSTYTVIIVCNNPKA